MKTSAAVALLLATNNARAVHTRAQKNIRALMAARSHGGNLLKLKDEPCDEGQDCSAKNDQVLLQTQSEPIPEGAFQPVPWGYVMGDNPQWMIVSRAEVNANGLADGFYVPDLWFLEQYQEQISTYVNT